MTDLSSPSLRPRTPPSRLAKLDYPAELTFILENSLSLSLSLYLALENPFPTYERQPVFPSTNSEKVRQRDGTRRYTIPLCCSNRALFLTVCLLSAASVNLSFYLYSRYFLFLSLSLSVSCFSDNNDLEM